MLERESTVERRLKEYAESLGIWTRKFISPSRRGVPDRVYLANGLVMFMEVKRPGETLTKLQRYELDLIRDHGGCAEWANSIEDGKDLILRLTK